MPYIQCLGIFFFCSFFFVDPFLFTIQKTLDFVSFAILCLDEGRLFSGGFPHGFAGLYRYDIGDYIGDYTTWSNYSDLTRVPHPKR